MEPTIIVHGGAGSHSVDQDERALKEAAEQGELVMQDGGSALDAVETAVNVLEDHPDFNAGRGGKLQLDGTVRLEAAVMTSDLDAGAVTGLEDVRHAVSVAREVLEETHHVMLGNGFATRFALERGFETSDLRTERTVAAWEDLQQEIGDLGFDAMLAELKDRDTGGTVGCVARDAEGRLAAGTSTGGRSPQLAGRIGDTPLIGSGTYCDDVAAVSATGIGEAIIQTTLARRCRDNVADGMDPDEAAADAISFLEDETGRHAGLIVVDAEGRIGSSHNAEEMRTVRRG